jgi:hypothetical protein
MLLVVGMGTAWGEMSNIRGAEGPADRISNSTTKDLPLFAAGDDEFPTDGDALSIWDWRRRWSVPRGLAAVAALGVSWFFSFHILFPAWLAPHRPRAPWPRDAFGRALAVFWLLACGTVLILFTAVFDDVRHSPSAVQSWFWRHGQWLAVLATGLGGAGLILYWFRHRGVRPGTDASRQEVLTRAR